MKPVKDSRRRTKGKSADSSSRYLSPFRYPGGKFWFIKTARKWLLASCLEGPRVLVEPFAGGAGISLIAVREKLVAKAAFAELDADVAATWETVLNGHAEWLTKEIRSFRISRQRVEAKLDEDPNTIYERAFQCLLRNRTSRGGLLTEGAGLIRHGEDGKGLRSRWYPETLSKRIETISSLKDRLRFRHGDGFQLIRDYLHRDDILFFVDPPYTQSARRLYRHWSIDHEKLFQLLQSVAGEVLMTYDDTPEVRTWANKYGFKVKAISMRTTHHRRKRELMVSRNFDWLTT